MLLTDKPLAVAAQLERLYQPYPADAMQRWPLSRSVSNAGGDSAELILNSQ